MPIVVRKHVLVDIDHTISNAFWRDPMIGTVSWDEYHAENRRDKPITEIIEMLRALSAAGYNIIGFTARPNKWRKQTMEWCVKHDAPLDELLMRPDDNFHPAPELKMGLAVSRFGQQFLPHSVAFVLDDRDDVIAAFKAIGITGLVVHARRSEEL